MSINHKIGRQDGKGDFERLITLTSLDYGWFMGRLYIVDTRSQI